MIRECPVSFKPRLETLEDRCCPGGGGGTVPPGTIYYSDWTPVRYQWGWGETFNGYYTMKADGSNKTASPNFAWEGEPSRQLHNGPWILSAEAVAGTYPNGFQRYELFATRGVDGLKTQLTNNPNVQPYYSGQRWAFDDSFFSFAAVTWTPVASQGNYTDANGNHWLADSGVFRTAVTWTGSAPSAATPIQVLDAGLYFETTWAKDNFYFRSDVTHLDWSPDATKLVYEQISQVSAGGAKDHHLRVTTFDVSGAPIQTTDLGKGIDPEWSPDGARIAFAAHNTSLSPNYVIKTVKPDGTGLFQVTKTSQNHDVHPNWSPDSKQIAFTRLTQSNTGGATKWLKDVLRVAAGGGSAVNLTKDINNNTYSVAWRSEAPALLAASTPTQSSTQTLSSVDANLLLNAAVHRWQAAGVDTTGLGNVQIQITNLGGRTLALAAGNTIWLDDNAAGWGWFVDSTPSDDSEFLTPGNQGEQRKIDLLTVLAHEIGHLLGHEHDDHGVMQETLSAGERHVLYAIDASQSWWLFALPDDTKKRNSFGWWL